MSGRLRLNPRDAIDEALGALLMHRLRATLSAVGIVLGIATVIAALAIGEGARREAVQEIGALGVDNIFLRATPTAPAPNRRERPDAPALTLQEADLIARTFDGIGTVGAVRVARSEVRAGLRHVETAIAGVSTSWADILNLAVAHGRWLSDEDQRWRSRVAVIGAGLAASLFGEGDPVGSRIFAGSTWYTVIGTLAPSDRAGRSAIARAFEAEQALLVPLLAMDLTLGRGDALDRVTEIAVRVNDTADVEAGALVVAAIAARSHGDAAGYEVVTPRQLLAARLRARRSFDVVLAAVGGIALLISGVGIMNIMLASVAERTHEIGVRRAVGARRAEVLAQFTTEASLLCLAGGCAGVPLGVIMAVAVAAAAGWPISVSFWSMALAVGLAVSVGIAFGVYPARLAARVDPIEALRAG